MHSFSSFIDMLKQFANGNGLYAILVVAYLMFLLQLREKERYIAVIAFILLVIGLFNPLSYIIFEKKMGSSATYYRFLWIIPYVQLFAYFIYESIRRFKNKKFRIMLVCLVCAGILWTSVKPEDLALPDNVYQIPDETLEVAVQLETLMEESGKESAMILADTFICDGIRQYNANIYLPFSIFAIASVDPGLKDDTAFGLMSMLMYNRNDISEEVVERIVEEKDIEYLILAMNNDISLAYMQQMNWQIVATTSSYYILRKA